MTSPEPLALELATPSGAPIRLTCDLATLGRANGDGGGAGPSPWRVEGKVGSDEVQALRLIAATFDDDRALALAALRPAGAEGHDAEVVACVLVRGGEAVDVEEALVSTEYDADGAPRRLGIELWVDPESAPVRAAADRSGAPETAGDPSPRETMRMAFRLEGTGGTGLYEVVRPA